MSEALHPKTLACYLESGNGRLVAISGTFPQPTLETLSASAPVFLELARRRKTWEVTSDPASAEELTALTPLAPECLVPILSCENNLIGMLVFGQRLSEEPYSGEDKRLLDSVAAQAGIALGNIALAERMAEQRKPIAASLRKSKLPSRCRPGFSRKSCPAIRTLEYTGGCIQAHQSGRKSESEFVIARNLARQTDAVK